MNVLDEAAQLIDGERQDQYGDASESHQRIADLWAGYLGTDVTEFDVVNMMILLKVSRTRNQYHRDSYVDIAGYSALGERLYQTAAATGVPVELHVEGFTKLRIPRTVGRVPDEPNVVWLDDQGDFLKVSNGIWYRRYGDEDGWIEFDASDVIPARECFYPYSEVLEDK